MSSATEEERMVAVRGQLVVNPANINVVSRVLRRAESKTDEVQAIACCRVIWDDSRVRVIGLEICQRGGAWPEPLWIDGCKLSRTQKKDIVRIREGISISAGDWGFSPGEASRIRDGLGRVGRIGYLGTFVLDNSIREQRRRNSP